MEVFRIHQTSACARAYFCLYAFANDVPIRFGFIFYYVLGINHFLPGHVFETAKGLGVFRASAGEVDLLLLFIFTAKWISGFILEE